MRQANISRFGFVAAGSILAALLVFGLFHDTRISAAPGRDAEAAVTGFNPVLTYASRGSADRTGRLMVLAKGPVTPSMLEALEKYGKVHGIIERYNIVAMTPRGPRGRQAIEGLPFVATVENDQPRYLADVGSWDRDIMDVVDVQESGTVGDPDPREVAQTGAGVHVVAIDTGLIKNWRTFLPEQSVRTDLARAFMGGGATADDFVPVDEFNTSNPTNLWERDTSSHGTAVTSHITGFKIAGMFVDGVAPGAQIIPLKVFPNGEAFTFSSRIIAAFAYATELKESGLGPMVITMSIGGGPASLEKVAVDDAIGAGIIVVTSAGNEGEQGMGWPAAYPEVISVGAIGWTRQFLPIMDGAPNGGFWWNLDVDNDPDGAGPLESAVAYVPDFSSRAIPSLGAAYGTDPQELDVLAPGIWTVAPGSHGPTAGYFYWAGTSFSTPLTAGVAALMLEKNPTLTQGTVESILKSSALPMNANDERLNVLEPLLLGGFYNPQWDDDCNGEPCDPAGAGLVQADAALAATP
jgi:subtilisin family serine protease